MDRSRFAERLAFIRAGGRTKRFHTIDTITENTVGEHSFGVAWLVYILTPDMTPSERFTMLVAALEHDLPEAEMGDLPAPAKRGMGIREEWNAYEARLLMSHGLGLGITEEAARILKLADALDGAFYACRERSLGNKGIAVCYRNFHSYVKEVINEENTVEAELLYQLEEEWSKANG